MFWFCSTMSMECTNPNPKSAQTAQLGQPAPKLELDLYIPQTQQGKIKNSFVIRRPKGINGEGRERKSLQHEKIDFFRSDFKRYSSSLVPLELRIPPLQSNSAPKFHQHFLLVSRLLSNYGIICITMTNVLINTYCIYCFKIAIKVMTFHALL